jgi:hypothetical protein
MGAIGGVFRTPSARFSPAQIHAGAKRAGFIVEITNEGPWAKVKVIGKIPPARLTRRSPEPPNVYFGAGKDYSTVDDRPALERGTYLPMPKQKQTPEKNKKRKKIKKIKKKVAPPMPLGGYVKNWRSLQKTAKPNTTPDIDIFS